MHAKNVNPSLFASSSACELVTKYSAEKIPAVAYMLRSLPSHSMKIHSILEQNEPWVKSLKILLENYLLQI